MTTVGDVRDELGRLWQSCSDCGPATYAAVIILGRAFDRRGLGRLAEEPLARMTDLVEKFLADLEAEPPPSGKEPS